MRLSNFVVCLASTALLLSAGCRKSAPEAPATPPPPVFQEVARVHWLGTDRIEADTNSAYVASLCRLPEATNLFAQTLEKLARAPWRSRGLSNEVSTATPPSELLRPLLVDLLRAESYLVARQASNCPVEAVLAIRLSTERQASWSTNLAACLGTLTTAAGSPTNLAWAMEWGKSNCVSFRPSEEWAVLSLGGAPESFASNVLATARGFKAPAPGQTNAWMQAEVSLPLLSSWLKLPAILRLSQARISATVGGEGEYLRTRAEMKFPYPLPLLLDPWQIPTNFIREPLISFTAIRGFRPLLSQLPWVRDREISPVPNQLYLWALNSADTFTFASVPMTNSAGEVDRLGPRLEGELNAWITNHALGFAEYSAPNHGIAWTSVPIITPAFQALPSGVGDVLFGRLSPILPPPGEYAPPELISTVAAQTNFVYYDWEITESRVKQWVFLGQSARVAFHRAQLPPGGLALGFLQAVAPKLGNSVSSVILTDPMTLTFTRKSHLGLTGFELHLLADWLESPLFPSSLHTLAAPPGELLRWRAKTRSFESTTNISPTIREP